MQRIGPAVRSWRMMLVLLVRDDDLTKVLQRGTNEGDAAPPAAGSDYHSCGSLAIFAWMVCFFSTTTASVSMKVMVSRLALAE